MDISHFLAKAFGLYYLAAGLLYAFRGGLMSSIINDYFDSPGQMFLGGAMTLILGILVVLGHPYWEPNWKSLITLMGYLMCIKGIMHWFFPAQAAALATRFIHGRVHAYLSGIILLIGVFFCYIGFFA